MSKNQTLTTPVGSAYYPRISTPDTKYNDDGVYSCKLHLSEDDYKAFELKINAIVDSAYKAECEKRGKKSLRKSNTNPVRINDDGEYEIFAKQVAQRHTEKYGLLEFKVVVYDSKAQKLNEVPNIGSGSKLKLNVEVNPYYTDAVGFGYQLRLKAVQIIDLVEYAPAGTTGFTAEEDGYVGTGESFTETFEAEDTETAPF